jgi:hypothetical protein
MKNKMTFLKIIVLTFTFCNLEVTLDRQVPLSATIQMTQASANGLLRACFSQAFKWCKANPGTCTSVVGGGLLMGPSVYQGWQYCLAGDPNALDPAITTEQMCESARQGFIAGAGCGHCDINQSDYEECLTAKRACENAAICQGFNRNPVTCAACPYHLPPGCACAPAPGGGNGGGSSAPADEAQ